MRWFPPPVCPLICKRLFLSKYKVLSAFDRIHLVKNFAFILYYLGNSLTSSKTEVSMSRSKLPFFSKAFNFRLGISSVKDTLKILTTSLLTLCKDSISFTSLSKYYNFFHKPQCLKCNVTCFPCIIFPYFFKPQRLKCNVTCFLRIIFLYFFKPQRLKYNVWNATLLVFRVSFSRTFSNRNVWKYSVWNATLLVFRVSFSRTFLKISRLSQTTTFENTCTTLLIISLKCLHYRFKTF